MCRIQIFLSSSTAICRTKTPQFLTNCLMDTSIRKLNEFVGSWFRCIHSSRRTIGLTKATTTLFLISRRSARVRKPWRSLRIMCHPWPSSSPTRNFPKWSQNSINRDKPNSTPFSTPWMSSKSYRGSKSSNHIKKCSASKTCKPFLIARKVSNSELQWCRS